MANSCKYYKQRRYVSYDNGITWQPLNEYRKGALYESDSEDCGYSVVYSWFDVSGEYTCSGCTKYQKTQKFISTDGGTTWEAVSPAEYGIGDVIELGSTDCGCSTQYRWNTLPSTEYICSGYTKYYKEVYQVSYDNGSTWANVVPEQTRMGDVIESASTDCGYSGIIYKWDVDTSEYICEGTTKYEMFKEYYSIDGGITWNETGETRRGAVIEHDSEDCGYLPPQPCNVITYRASSKLNEYYYVNNSGVKNVLSTKGFNGANRQQLTMTSHTFENGVGTVTFNGDIISIAKNTFLGCSGLTNVNIPNCVERIGYSVFGECTSLRSINIPDSVTYIDQYIFQHCSGLTSCTIGSGLTTIGLGAFLGCSGLTNIEIPNNVTTIQYEAFMRCSSLESVTIPSGVTYIGSYVFNDCYSLTSCTMTDSITSIGSDAFSYCTKLASIVIPSGVTSIGDRAFYNCRGLTSIIVMATTPPLLTNQSSDTSWTVFYNTNDCPIYVPAESVNTYKSNSRWGNYASRIQAIP